MNHEVMDSWSGDEIGSAYSSYSTGHEVYYNADYCYLAMDATILFSVFGNHRRIQLLMGLDLCSRTLLNRKLYENSFINYQSSSSGHPRLMPDGSYTFVTFHSYSETVSKVTDNIAWVNKDFYLFPILQLGLECTILRNWNLRAMGMISPGALTQDNNEYNLILPEKIGFGVALGYVFKTR